jgi:copper chaperone CopZ
MESSTDKRKRVHDESSTDSETHCVDSVETKIRKFNSVSDVTSSELESQLTRVDSGSDSVFDSDVQLQDEIFHMLDDADNVPEQTERDSAVMGLDSVIKSFEEEIFAPGFKPGQTDPVQVAGSVELGYLFEASDDELGLPPTVVSGDEPGRVEPEKVDLTGFVGFDDDDFSGFDGFGYETGLLSECDGNNGGAGGFVTGDGLFEYGEPVSDVLWRSESLQAM